MDNPKYLELMSKYLSGNIAPAERQDLLTWAESSADNRIFFDEMIQVWSMSGDYEEEPMFALDVEAAWDNLEPRLFEEQLPDAEEDLEAPTQADEVNQMPGAEEDIEVPTRADDEQEPPVSPGKIIPFFYRRKTWAIAASIALIFSVGTFLFPQIFQSPTAIVATTDGETLDVLLPDGTKILLNANSTLKYPRKFKTREVSLEGEAYFDVASISGRPFSIESGEVTTTVVGTAFNIRAYPQEEAVEVTVAEGIVEVAAPEKVVEDAPDITSPKKGPKVLRLEPGQAVVYDEKEEALTEIEEVEQVNIATAWKTRVLEFNEVPLTTVSKTLERFYGIEIEIDEEKYKDYPVFYPAEVNPSLDSVISSIQVMMPDLKFIPTGNKTYRVEGE